jgi:histone-lysine N-methyltransferase SETMAR
MVVSSPVCGCYAVAIVGWEIVNYPPYSPVLAPSEFNLFEPMKVHLGEQKFPTDYELKRSVSDWLSSQNETFYVAGVMDDVCSCKERIR